AQNIARATSRDFPMVPVDSRRIPARGAPSATAERSTVTARLRRAILTRAGVRVTPGALMLAHVRVQLLFGHAPLPADLEGAQLFAQPFVVIERLGADAELLRDFIDVQQAQLLQPPTSLPMRLPLRHLRCCVCHGTAVRRRGDPRVFARLR